MIILDYELELSQVINLRKYLLWQRRTQLDDLINLLCAKSNEEMEHYY